MGDARFYTVYDSAPHLTGEVNLLLCTNIVPPCHLLQGPSGQTGISGQSGRSGKRVRLFTAVSS